MSDSKQSVLTALIGAAAGAAVAALITSSSTRNVERDKFNYQLIQDALAGDSPKTRLERLKFLLDAHLITDQSLLATLNSRIDDAKTKGTDLPHIPPASAPAPTRHERYDPEGRR
jgi:hypothetical protein